MNVEAPRLFTDYSKLITKLDKEILTRTLREKKETFLRRRQPYDVVAIEQAAIDELITKYILSRLTLEMETKSKEHFYVYLKAQFDDVMVTEKSKLLINGACPDYALDFLIPMPRYLNPVITMHLSKLRSSMFLRCLDAFQHNAQLVSASCEFFLHASETSLEPKLPLWRQRWIRAIDKVIHRNLYAKILIRLTMQEQSRRLAAIKSELSVDTNAAKTKVMRRGGCPSSPQHGGSSSSPTSVGQLLSHSRSQDNHLPTIPLLRINASADSSSHRRPLTSGHANRDKFGSPTAAAKAASRAVSNSRGDRYRPMTFAPPIAGAISISAATSPSSSRVASRATTSSRVFR